MVMFHVLYSNIAIYLGNEPIQLIDRGEEMAEEENSWAPGDEERLYQDYQTTY
jgi:hypothetical protein